MPVGIYRQELFILQEIKLRIIPFVRLIVFEDR